MTTDEKFMQRCLALALNGKGRVAPNPMVGAVIVRDGQIIGEGYHRQYGGPHAEVNAFNSVVDKSMIAGSDMYVSLEPCSHFGKTPPCANRIIAEKIKRVIIAVVDPNPLVAGRGVRLLLDAGIEVELNILEQEAKEINKEFFVYQTAQRPFVYLKWAQTKNNFIDQTRLPGQPAEPTVISSDYHKVIVHKLRSETMAIMIGTNTAINDNPHLTTRLWKGKNPVRIVVDRKGRIPENFHIFNNAVPTFVYTEKCETEIVSGSTTYIPIRFTETMLETILHDLRLRKISSLMVEGGAQLLQSFIDSNLWNEAYIEIADKEFTNGVKAPVIEGEIQDIQKDRGSVIIHRKNNKMRN
ncbi:MAG: bifunctional diaminohydroxyphosphoribosylaminopyrimidine deaminase/5-amino-6-(5-phosphoribosylamino)uracil reductase RibD [Dysgonamonadaceae bacterium]